MLKPLTTVTIREVETHCFFSVDDALQHLAEVFFDQNQPFEVCEGFVDCK